MPAKRRPPSSAVQNPLETYLREINDTSLLSADDEKRLAHAIARGDAAARDHMVRANLRLVVNIARGYANRGLPLPDLIEEGNLGLLRAVEGFDPKVGTRFSTYASYWIKQSIKRALINSGKTIRIPAYMVEQPDGGWSLGEIVRDENMKCPAEVLLDEDTMKHVLERIERLDDRASKILKLRFGLGGGEPMTLKEIGAELGLTRERVRQIEAETLAMLALELDGVPRATIQLRRGA